MIEVLEQLSRCHAAEELLDKHRGECGWPERLGRGRETDYYEVMVMARAKVPAGE
jgi:hypothetical protein